MWRNKLRLAVIFAVALLVIFLGLDFKFVNITDRAFVLGLGIDYADSQYELTCEILVPAKFAGGGSANEESHKILSGVGIDAAHALNDVFKKTGKLPSLGHCSVLILGETVYTQEVLEELEFFLKSDSFRASVTVAVCEGAAKDLMNTKTPLEKFTSLSLFEITSVYGKNTNSTTTTLGEFREKMLSSSASSYLTFIKTLPADEGGSEGGDEDEDSAAGSGEGQETVFYDCTQAAVFNKNGFRGFLTSREAEGLMLLDKKNNFSTFRVSDEQGRHHTVSLASKKVRVKTEFEKTPKIIFELAVKLKLTEAEELNTVEGFVSDSKITAAMREGVRQQMTDKIVAARQKAVEKNADVLYLANKFYARFGKKWTAYAANNPDYLSKVDFELKITVK